MQISWLGRIYTSHLKQYAFVSRTVSWIWRNGYPIYIAINIFNRKAKRWRTLTKLSEFSKNRELPIYKLLDAACVETPEPKVFPGCDQGYLISPHERYEFPEIFVTIINNATIFGRTNFILAEGEVICHDLFDFKRDYTSEELHGRAVIDPLFQRIRWLHRDDAAQRLPAAAAFVDACATNYAHWLSEVLPRVSAFCSEENFKGIPIVVDDRLHKNIMESLFLVVGSEREIIRLPVGRALYVDKLYVTSVAGYVPFERRTNKLSGHSHGVFCSHTFECLRKDLLSLAQKNENVSWPEKILIRRNSGARNFTNMADLEKLLVLHGYVIVNPEKYTFLQQVQLFGNAKIIIGSSGAALANIVFSSPETKIIILIGKHPDTSYWYWQNMACSSGKTVSYVMGEISARNCYGIHADFSVDLDILLHELGEDL